MLNRRLRILIIIRGNSKKITERVRRWLSFLFQLLSQMISCNLVAFSQAYHASTLRPSGVSIPYIYIKPALECSPHPTFPHHHPQRLAFSHSEKKPSLRDAFCCRNQSFRRRVRRCRRRYTLSLRPFERVIITVVSDILSLFRVQLMS